MINKLLVVSIMTMALAGCGVVVRKNEAINENIAALPDNDPSIYAKPITKLKTSEIETLPGPGGPPITIAVYSFTDKTGQRKPNDKLALFSSAVTQGAEVFLIKALQDAGKGKWFQVVERIGLDDLIKERHFHLTLVKENYDFTQGDLT